MSLQFINCQTNIDNELFFSKEQLPKNIKKITQYENGRLLSIFEYDSLKNLTFFYYKEFIHERFNHKYIIRIKCNLYDSNSKVIKWYYLNSNTGLSVYQEELDSLGNVVKEFIKEAEDFYTVNSNPFYFISKIKNKEDLFESKEIKVFENVSTTRLLKESEYNKLNNLITSKHFDDNHLISEVENFEFDVQNRLKSEVHNYSDGLNYRFNYTYNDSLNYKIKFIEKIITSDSIEDIDVNTKIYKYNEYGKIVEHIELKNGQKYLKLKFNYAIENKVVVKEYDFYEEKPYLTYITQNFYENSGFLIKRLIEFVPSGEVEKRKYKYKLEFYDK